MIASRQCGGEAPRSAQRHRLGGHIADVTIGPRNDAHRQGIPPRPIRMADISGNADRKKPKVARACTTYEKPGGP
jgi:hypothetical protein